MRNLTEDAVVGIHAPRVGHVDLVLHERGLRRWNDTHTLAVKAGRDRVVVEAARGSATATLDTGAPSVVAVGVDSIGECRPRSNNNINSNEGHGPTNRRGCGARGVGCGGVPSLAAAATWVEDGKVRPADAVAATRARTASRGTAPCSGCPAAAVTLATEYAKVVYERPNPNGTTGLST